MALREIGEHNVTEEHLSVIKQHLSTVLQEDFQTDIQLAPIWVRKTLSRL